MQFVFVTALQAAIYLEVAKLPQEQLSLLSHEMEVCLCVGGHISL